MENAKPTGIASDDDGMLTISRAELGQMVKIAVNDAMRTQLGEAIEDHLKMLRPDSCEVSDDAKGNPKVTVKKYANSVEEAVTAAVAAYNTAKMGLPAAK